MAQKINLEKLQQDINSRSLTAPESQTRSASEIAKQERVMDRLWLRLQEIYGHQLNSQFGETIPESWERLLMDLSPEQIADGLNRLADRKDTWPPNGQEFRQLCLPVTLSPDGQNKAAYLSFDDPRHPRNDPSSPEYVSKAKGISSDKHISKRKRAGNEALEELRKLL